MKNRVLKKWLFLLQVFIIPTCLYGQVGKLYSAELDLSNSLINYLYQDSYGFVWTSTEYGLNKYDGTRFTIYKNNEKNPTSLKNNYVRLSFEDNKRRLWIGGINGIQIYDRDKDNFKEIPIIKNGKRVFPSVISIIQIHNGEIWIGTVGRGIFSYDETKGIAVSKNDINKGIGTLFTSCLLEDSQLNIWIGTEDNGVICYIPAIRKFRNYKYPQLSNNRVSAIAENKSGQIFVATLNNGVNLFDKNTNSFKTIDNNTSLPIKSLFVNSKDELLIGTDGNGLMTYNKNSGHLDYYQPAHSSYNLSSGKVHTILEDRDGNLWLGVFQKGILFLPKIESKFDTWNLVKKDSHNIISSCVMCMRRTTDGKIWVAVDSEGLFELNDSGEIKRHFARIKGDSNSVPSTIMCMFEDSNKNLWLGSYTHGLAQFDKNSGKCTYINPLRDKRIYSLTECNDHKLYICTLGSGLYSYNLTTHELKHYDMRSSLGRNFSDSEKLGAAMGFITSVYDGKDLIWLGHFKGINCFNIRTNSFIELKDINKRLNGRSCYSLMKDSHNNIWIGTSSGLFLYDSKTKLIKEYSTANGLSNEVISGICEDSRHQIWCSTYYGITKLDPQSGKCLNFFIQDGLQGNEYTYGAYYKDKSGLIYFGGTNGLTRFNPDLIQESRRHLRLQITNFYLYNNQPVNTRTKSGSHFVIQQSVLKNEVYSLAHSDNTFTIEFSTMDFSNPERIIYEYKMEGLSDQWTSSRPGINRVTYNNLRSGNYTFVVKARDGDNYSEEKRIHIFIAHPWYSSSWAFLLYFCLLATFIAGLANIIRSKREQLKEVRKRKDAEKINEAKLQFFINISHEIRTPMTLIVNPLEKLLKTTQDIEMKKTFILMHRNGQRILRLINQLLDVRKIDKGQMYIKCRETDIVGFIKDLMLTFSYAAEKKNINFRFFHEDEELKVWIDLNNFDKVLMNLLTNAFKFTADGGEITITLTTGTNPLAKDALKNYFEIAVLDNGIGLIPDKIEKIFERFYQIDNDITQSNFGTGIGLHLSKSLVELHHGNIKAENRKDCSGSKFTVRLPLGCNHLKSAELVDPEELHLTSELPAHNFYSTKEDTDEDIETHDTVEIEKAKTKTKYRILIVEDEDDIRNYLEQELNKFYHVSTCENGKIALELALTTNVDLIISDIMMPEMDGLTLCKKLKQNVNINHIPIILLTAKSKMEDKMLGMETGADAYFVKPFIIEELQATIDNLLSNREMLKNKFNGSQSQEDKVKKISLKSSDEILMERIMKAVNGHIDNPKFSVEELASEVGLSRVHIHRKLKELTNQSASDFIKSIRLKQAATLLSEKKMSISEVAYAVGYTNLSHFSATFREQFGETPKEYMNRQNKEKENSSENNT